MHKLYKYNYRPMRIYHILGGIVTLVTASITASSSTTYITPINVSQNLGPAALYLRFYPLHDSDYSYLFHFLKLLIPFAYLYNEGVRLTALLHLHPLTAFR